ncbi:hypothetical protein PPK14_gp03 [Bacillus phage vB_BspS_SplendidRed]|uniref:Uncharacterized protein n=1 Tax=Bacillus phage vB_BspS_SplendidRed TaxID=2591379 RepID=A0A5B9NGW1_9CAUD|nr:hypothetical protein PPK14_gp03 [Bacillus phage vB_BspS_SplendidRed]QEG13477.1 hypothetical protein SPLENDIDRED_3 [Bacillus phage vB_BspS_SplendidRed]
MTNYGLKIGNWYMKHHQVNFDSKEVELFLTNKKSEAASFVEDALDRLRDMAVDLGGEIVDLKECPHCGKVI